MTHLRRKTTTRDFPLNIAQLLELDMGPKRSGSAFADEDELRRAWEANRDEVLDRYAFTLHDAGWRPAAYWYLEADDPTLYDDEASSDRLRWLRDHDAFLPGELAAMRRTAKRDPDGYAADAVKVLEGLP